AEQCLGRAAIERRNADAARPERDGRARRAGRQDSRKRTGRPERQGDTPFGVWTGPEHSGPLLLNAVVCRRGGSFLPESRGRVDRRSVRPEEESTSSVKDSDCPFQRSMLPGPYAWPSSPSSRPLTVSTSSAASGRVWHPPPGRRE